MIAAYSLPLSMPCMVWASYVSIEWRDPCAIRWTSGTVAEESKAVVQGWEVSSGPRGLRFTIMTEERVVHPRIASPRAKLHTCIRPAAPVFSEDRVRIVPAPRFAWGGDCYEHCSLPLHCSWDEAVVRADDNAGGVGFWGRVSIAEMESARTLPGWWK